MVFTAHITKVATGETRKFICPEEYDDGYRYMWQDGNYECDCNRESFFAEAGGEELPDAECGSERFRVTHLELPNGRCVLIDSRGRDVWPS